jgi:acyl carrier protein
VTSLTEEHLDRVWRSKVAGAVNLLELTREMDLSAVVLYSSASGTLGGAGMADYAAANAYLDALAARARSQGRPVISLGWGLWAEPGGMVGRLAPADVQRMTRSGVLPMDAGDGIALFDAAVSSKEPAVLPIRFDHTRLRARAADDELPAVLRSLVPAVPRPAVVDTSLAARLAAMGEQEQRKVLDELVRTQAAAVLGHGSPAAVTSDEPFKKLGFDSLTAVELRNRLNAATGLRLPATVVFDHPKPALLAEFLRAELAPAQPRSSLVDEVDRLEQLLAASGAEERAEVGDRLRALLARWTQPAGSEFDTATDDELFALIDEKFGR